MKRGTLDAFVVSSQPKKLKLEDNHESTPASARLTDASSTPASDLPPSTHTTYPYPVAQLPPHIDTALSQGPASDGREINDQADLDLLYFEPFVSRAIAKDLFTFLRESLFFYRVKYTIKRGPVETNINTPRFTTVFGVDTSCKFAPNGELLSTVTGEPVPATSRYSCTPRPIPGCLDALRKITEVFTGSTFNFCLVNYYASGEDSISYHSDDERFLGAEPAIASFSFGAKRDFLLKHKPPDQGKKGQAKQGGVGEVREKSAAEKPLKFPLASGDMIVMRGTTQSNWLHSIPKRKGGEAEQGRINITFRKALVKGGTENYYKYNVGAGDGEEVFKWDLSAREMRIWKA